MASEQTKNIKLTVYPDISGVSHRDIRQSYYNNFIAIDKQFKDAEDALKEYVDQKIGEIENGTY